MLSYWLSKNNSCWKSNLLQLLYKCQKFSFAVATVPKKKAMHFVRIKSGSAFRLGATNFLETTELEFLNNPRGLGTE
jgi:hypothetical protein